MKLFYSRTSPYSRKALVLLYEKGLLQKTELALTDPFGEAPELKSLNPLGKIPTLIDGDLLLYDSPVICEYIDAKSASPWLSFSSGKGPSQERFLELRRAALADGLIDAALAIVLENRRDTKERSPAWIAKQHKSIERSLPVMEEDAKAFATPVSFSQVAFGCALGYLDFRLPDLDWRSPHPALADWFEAFSKRQSMIETRPPAA